LYGLKQTPKLSHEKFDNVMLSNGFNINECVYVKNKYNICHCFSTCGWYIDNINEYNKSVYLKNINTTYVIVCLHMDDILILNSNTNIIKTNKQILINRFNI
jgi:hypothetical protein